MDQARWKNWNYANKKRAQERILNLEDILRELLEQLDGIGVPDWHGAEGLDLTRARTILEGSAP